MAIRLAKEADWAAIWPFWRDIVEAGETYAYPLDGAKVMSYSKLDAGQDETQR